MSRVASLTHAFSLYQGRREHDGEFLNTHDTSRSTRSTLTQYGAHLMRSRLEALWAQRFEERGYIQAAYGIAPAPCYFYEPRGMKRWPTYQAGHHYRIDFTLVRAVTTQVLEGEARSCALRWEWVSIKPKADPVDLAHLKALVTFDSKHQRAFQCCGDPWKHPSIYAVTWNGTTTAVQRIDE